ncbi:SPOR domain-containing protein [Cognataquiflexum rubidum]|uniref:SPOR domain-containing protein n=1 Tax=Cognataquiflexum rubidum TaxID=2922273 RepID=UPI001F12B4D1|nr:SPOR domain-containing protein [Cognataquiflexum rubidum]
MWKISKPTKLVLLLLFLLGFSNPIQAQQEPDGEALLILSHPSTGQVYLNALFFGDKAYLPVGEVLSLLYIPNERLSSGKGLSGVFPDKKNPWSIDPIQNKIMINGKEETLPADKFFLGDTDLYFHPDYYLRIFGLQFTVNILNLSASFTAQYPLPVEERQKREMLRKNLQSNNKTDESVPMLYDRERKFLSLGLMDYVLNFDKTDQGTNTSFQLRTGMELLGGDFEGAIAGNQNGKNIDIDYSGLRWRYVLPGAMKPEKNVLLTTITAGQINTSSQTNSLALTGISISNNPVVPRQELDVFIIDGYTEADSEVELLIGGQLVDFSRADEVGYYRFNAPISFGTTRLTIRIYTPNGEVITEDRQFQIPFTFLPKGFVTYNIQTGFVQNSLDSLSDNRATHGDVAIGLSNSVTVRAGIDYGNPFGENKMYHVYGISTRIFQQYLFNVDVLPDRYYRATGSVFYANNVNISTQVTEYVGSSEFTRENQIRDANLNVFLPFKLFGRFTGIRVSGEKIWLEGGFRSNIQADFNTQIGRVSTRFNYRGDIAGNFNLSENESWNTKGLLTSSLTYSLPRSPSLPVFVRGIFFRGQMRYDVKGNKPIAWNTLFSQTLFKHGRFTLGYERDMINKQGQLQVGFLYDFNAIRTSSQFNKRGKSYAARQSFSGSLAYDPAGKMILPSNRDQIGRSGISVRMFVDQNNNEKYDEGEEIVPAKAVQLDRSANMVLGSDGILRMSQMQSYWTYKMTIDISSLPDPSLAPKVTSFNLVAEPNRYKQIDVPLYRTGTIEGMAIINKNGEKQGIGGLRLLLKKVGSKDFLETIRTFSDGGFYTFSLLPGKYTLEIDPAQLDFLQAKIVQEVLEFEIKALSEGDYIEGLNFELNPISEELAADMAEISDPESEESEDVENEATTAEETPDFFSDSKLGHSKLSIVIEKEQVPYYYVIVATSPDKTSARIEAQKFIDKGKAVWIIFPNNETENYRIAVGKYKDYKSAAKALEKAKIESAETSWILKY